MFLYWLISHRTCPKGNKQQQGHVTVSGPVRKRISVWSLSHACQHSWKNVDFGTRFFWRKHARMQPKMCFPSHARHCFPSTAFSSFLRAPRGFRVRPRRRLFRVRIFQCRLRSTQASVSVPTLTFMRASNVLRSASELMHVLGLGVS